LINKRTAQNPGVALDIQIEMVHQGTTLAQTGAGQEMNAQILAMRRHYEEKIEQLQADLKVAVAKKDQEWKSQIEAERRETKAKVEKDEKNRQKLQADNEELKKRLNERRLSFDRDLHATDLLMKNMEYELLIMRERNEAAERQQALRNELQAKENRLEILRWKIRQAQACIVM